jgi:flagellar hook-basal body complex protein FliE
MEIGSIGSLYANAVGAAGKAPSATEASEASEAEFQNILLDAMKDADETDAVDKQSTEELLSGDTNSLSDAVIATEKADIALRLTVQIRNRVIDAYNEVMRMQV